MSDSYPEFFFGVTKNPPLPYQQRYGENPFVPTLLIVPTGLGKTDTVLLPWLYGRVTGNPATPTRLILVLPRQNLTRQTAANARTKAAAAGVDVPVLELMGGSQDNEERLRPDEAAIIVATQDLYFSRALNRGYARRPPRWPIDFALYNQDCLIVLDEVQIMDDALATSTQLAAFRTQYKTCGNAPCVWMSATADPKWLQTVDFRELPRVIELDGGDRASEVVKKRIHAAKAIQAAPEECRKPAGCAAFALKEHRPGTRTLIIANTVARAREIAVAVRKSLTSCVLLHSRFRRADREGAAKHLDDPLPDEGQVVVATQVLEAGVDLSSRLLITDLAPWGSLIQRFGRVNRRGDDAESEIYWVDGPEYAKQKSPTAPYTAGQLEHAKSHLQTLQSAAPADLPPEDGEAPYEHVLRRADLLDLFDTTPDLGGNDLDVSRFIRSGDEKDVYLAWRDWPAEGKPPMKPDLRDDELCPVPMGEFRDFVTKHAVYTLSFANEEWARIDKETPLYPGMVAVARCSEGGYTPLDGWAPESKVKVPMVDFDARQGDREGETDTTDWRSFPKYRQTLSAHTERVQEELEVLLTRLDVGGEWAAALRSAGLKHDWGKVHEVFQATMHLSDQTPDLLAKQCGSGRHSRKHFRHELASALAMLQTGETDLATYLAAAHHGRIRLAIRSMPGEKPRGEQAIARGIYEGDTLPACELGTARLPGVTLSLAPMRFGAEGGSWTERMLRLRDEIGVFRLAYLETLLRAADEMASGQPGTEFETCPSTN